MKMTKAEFVLIVVTVLIGLFLIFALPAESAAFDLLNPEWLDDWTGAERMMLGGLAVLTFEDFLQTQTIADRQDRWQEANPLLGRHPESWQVTTYFAASSAAVLTAANLAGEIKGKVFGIPIGPLLRKGILIGAIYAEAKCVDKNASNGVYFTFKLI